jgi:hypothetical protein
MDAADLSTGFRRLPADAVISFDPIDPEKFREDAAA